MSFISLHGRKVGGACRRHHRRRTVYRTARRLLSSQIDPNAHIPVLLPSVLNFLDSKTSDRWYIDGTFGNGGYSRKVLEQDPTCRVVAVDRDGEAIERAKWLKSQTGFSDRLFPLHGSLDSLPLLLKTLPSLYSSHARIFPKDNRYSALILDLGVSSNQLDSNRGFSYRFDSELDMRMDRSSGITAAQFINQSRYEDLTQVLKEYGEERFSGRIARKIVESRPIYTTKQLKDVVLKATEGIRRRIAYEKREDKHPAVRVFQALRIHVNNELQSLQQLLHLTPSILRPSGLLIAVSFHSLEDRLIKRFLQAGEGRIPSSNVTYLKTAVEGRGEGKQWEVLTKKPITPSKEEIELNPRARSAKLRVGRYLGTER